MSQQQLSKEQLSALLDEELTEFELRRLLQQEPEQQALAAMSRWQLARDVMKGQSVSVAPAGFAEQVALAVSAEKHEAKPQWWSGITKTLVAASVAAATVTVGWQFWQTDATGQGGAPAVANVEPAKESPISQMVRLGMGSQSELVGLNPSGHKTERQQPPVEFLGPLLREPYTTKEERERAVPQIQMIELVPSRQQEGH